MEDTVMSKRQRTNAEGHGVGTDSEDKFEDPHKPPMSRVVHVILLTEDARASDLQEAVWNFGPVRNIGMVWSRCSPQLPHCRDQALIEFESNKVYVCGQPAFFNYSTSHEIRGRESRDGAAVGVTVAPEDTSDPPNNILLFTHYPITVDVMHTICSTHGNILRIVIFNLSPEGTTKATLDLSPRCRCKQDKFEDPHKPPMSRVVHVILLTEYARASDLHEAVWNFGLTRNIVLMWSRGCRSQALVEFETQQSAKNCVQCSQSNKVYVCGQPAFFTYSTSQEIHDRDGASGGVTVAKCKEGMQMQKPLLPDPHIASGVLSVPQQVAEHLEPSDDSSGPSLVDYSERRSLPISIPDYHAVGNGSDKYVGKRLNVVRNDTETWDYTHPHLEPHDVAPTNQRPFQVFHDDQENSQPMKTDGTKRGLGLWLIHEDAASHVRTEASNVMPGNKGGLPFTIHCDTDTEGESEDESDEMEGIGDEEERQLQLALAMSKEEHDQEQKQQQNYNIKLQIAIEESRKWAAQEPVPQKNTHLLDLTNSPQHQTTDPCGAPLKKPPQKKPPPTTTDPWAPSPKPPPTDPWGMPSSQSTNSLQGGNPIGPNMPTSQNIRASDQLQQRLQEMEETILCPICMERKRNMAFMCGHTVCSTCGESLKTCHMCRKAVSKRITLF